MKILYVTTVGITMKFFESFIKNLLKDKHVVDIATNETSSKVPDCYREWGCKVYPIKTSRFPLSMGNIKAIKQIKKNVENNYYDIVHCHTPLAAMATRLACIKARKHGTRVFYTAHGFHFYEGAPKHNWIIYYPIEKFCSYFTDVLITMNQEDYEFAKRKMKANKVIYVPGVGIELEKYANVSVDRAFKRKEIGVPNENTLIISVGELNYNKNHETVIRAIADLKDVYYIIAGKGELHEHLQNLIDELGMADRVRLLGFRNDIPELCRASDVFAFPSYREGLPLSVMEAMASGLSVVCSRIRGNTDLIDENGGVLFDPNSVEDCQNAIKEILAKDLKIMGDYNLGKIKEFGTEKINEEMSQIYSC